MDLLRERAARQAVRVASAIPVKPSAVADVRERQNSGSRIPSRSIFDRIFGFSCFVLSAASLSTVLISVTVSAWISTSQPESGCTCRSGCARELQRLARGQVGGRPGGRADDAAVPGSGIRASTGTVAWITSR